MSRHRGAAVGFAALALTALAGLIRLPTLGHQSLWLDEAYTDHLVHMSFGAMLHGIRATESTPPVFYVVVWAFTHVFGSSAFALRFVSALAGVATVPVACALAGRLAGRRAAALAGALVALSPLLVWFSQEARSYALATLLSMLTLLCLVWYLDERDGRWLAGWAVTAALGIATHYFVVFVVASEAVWLLHRRRADRRAWAAIGCVAAVGAALAPLALAQRGTGHADYIAQGSLAARVAQVPKQFLIGYATPHQILWGVAAAVLVAAGVIAPLVRSRTVREAAALPLAIALATVLAPIALALLGVDFLDTRNVLPALPVFLVAAAVALDGIPRATFIALIAGGLAGLFVLVTILIDVNPRYQRDNWRGVSAALGPPRVARAVVVSPGSGPTALTVYQPTLRSMSAARVSEIDVVAIPARSAGGGTGTPPRPARLAVPPGFHLIAADEPATYTVLRFRATAPVALTVRELAPLHLGNGGFGVLVQVPR